METISKSILFCIEMEQYVNQNIFRDTFTVIHSIFLFFVIIYYLIYFLNFF